jgi:hypothetical protein
MIMVTVLFGDRHVRRGLLPTLCLFLLGLATGMSHEIVGIPVSVSLVIMMIISRRFRTVPFIAALVGLAGGMMALVTCPGMISRVMSQGPGIVRSPWYAFFNINDSVPFIVMMALYVRVFFMRDRLSEGNRQFLLFCLAMAVTGVVLVYGIFGWGRIWFLVNVISIMASLMCIRIIMGVHGLRYNIWRISFSILLLGVAYLHLGYVGYYSLVFRRLSREQIARYVQSPSGEFWGEVITMNELPAICGYLPDIQFNSSGMEYVRHYFSFGEPRYMGDEYILPDKLKYVDSKSGTPVPGGNVRVLNGFYFMPLPSVIDSKYGLMPMEFDFGKGWTSAECVYKVFRSESDGKEYVFIKPDFDWYVTHFKRIRRMRMERE